MSKADNKLSPIMSRYKKSFEEEENSTFDIKPFLSSSDKSNKKSIANKTEKSIFEIELEETPNNDFPTNTLLKVNSNMNIFKMDLDKLYDAPPDWNFFPELDSEKFEELIESIMENGLLVPLVAWDQGNGKYMILSGHNRKKAYEEIYKRTNDDTYKKIFCTVKNKDDITIEEAKTIIIDTNFVQRELTPSIKTRCIVEKYDYIGRKKYGSDEKSAVERIAEEYGISRRWVFTYYKLGKLIPEIMKMVDDNSLSINSGKVLANLSPEIQKTLFFQYGGYLNNKNIKQLNINSNKSELIESLIKNKEDNYIKITTTIPKSKQHEFKNYIDKWLKENEN